MKWYEVVVGIILVIIGIYIRGKLFNNWKYRNYNDSWRNREN